MRLLLERVLVEVVRRHGKGARRVPLAWRKPNDARADAPGRAARDAEHLYGADGARRRTAPRRPRLRRDRRDPQRGRVATGQASRHLQCANGSSSADQIGRRDDQISPSDPPQIERLANEWTIRELAEEIGMPQPTLYTWVQKGRLRRRAGSRLRPRQTGAGRSRDDRGLERRSERPRRLGAACRQGSPNRRPNNRILRVAMPGRYR